MAKMAEPWTAKELARLPAGWRYEIDAGELIIMAPAGRRHGQLVVHIATLLNVFVTAHQLGEVNGAELGVYLQDNPETLRGVDVAFYSVARVRQLGGETGFVHVPPDLAVEVHDSSEPDIHRKVEQYLAAGVRSVWVVDPERRTLVQYRPGDNARVIADPDAAVEDGVLPGFSCRLGELLLADR